MRKQRRTARLLSRPVLNDLDRKRILPACQSATHLRQYVSLRQADDISPKLDEFADVVEDLMSSGDHRRSCQPVGDVLNRRPKSGSPRRRLRTLAWRLARQDRRAVLEEFNKKTARVPEYGCRRSWSHLQAADTVVNWIAVEPGGAGTANAA